MSGDRNEPSKLRAAYRIERLLGRGGMGEVHLAWDRRLERHVAVKRILGEPAPDERARERFRREAKAAARLNHPAIVQVYDLIEGDAEDVLILEYVEGEELSELLAAGPLEVDSALRLATDIADGLAAAHAAGLVHRDLKKENILVTADQRAKILDFGLARLLWQGETTEGEAAEDGPRKLTRSGALLGTVHAMSPEQASGRSVDHRSDLFALGGVLYEMLCGLPPFTGLNLLDTLRRVVSEEPLPLAERRPGLPRDLVLLATELLQKDPRHRPQNARLVTQRLGEIRRRLENRDLELPLPGRAHSPGEAATGEWSSTETLEGGMALDAGRGGAWRAQVGMSLPGRPLWCLERCLDTSDSGERWIAAHEAGERRVLTFSTSHHEVEILRQEVTFSRLLRETLGRRADIAQVLDWNLEQPPFYVERQYSKLGDLETWSRARGGLDRLPLELRLGLMADLCAALAAVHGARVVHGELCPASVLVAESDDGGSGILLTGFRASGHAPASSCYTAPEILEGEAPTPKSDLFALGVLIYQFAAGDLGRVLAPGWRRDVDELLAEDIALLVDRSPDRRSASAEDFVRRLQHFERRREERRERALAMKNQETLKRSRARRKRWASIAALLAVMLIIVTWQQRRAVREAARADQEKETAESVSEFVVSLFEVADPGTGGPSAGAGSVTALELLDRGRESLGYRLQDQPRTRAILSRTLGRLYASLGDFDRASPLLEDSVAQLEGRDRPELAASRHELAKLHLAFGEAHRAVGLLEESLEERLAVLGPVHADVAANHADLGLAHLAAGDIDAAGRELRRALALYRRLFGPEHRTVAAVLHNLSRVHEAQGESDLAEERLREVLAMQKKLLGEPHPDIAASLNNLGVFLYRGGDLAAAESHLRQALEQKRQVFGETHPEVAAGLNNLGVLLQGEDDTESRRLYEKALLIYRELFGDKHPHVLNTLVNLAILDLALGHQEAAELRCREARAVLRRLTGDSAELDSALEPCAGLAEGGLNRRVSP